MKQKYLVPGDKVNKNYLLPNESYKKKLGNQMVKHVKVREELIMRKRELVEWKMSERGDGYGG